MTADEFKAWRAALNWSTAEAGRQLGLTGRMVRYYEAGNPIPRYIDLAARALRRWKAWRLRA